MQDILIRIETDDFPAWEEQHYLHAGNRATYGIEDGPAYRDLENPTLSRRRHISRPGEPERGPLSHQDRGRRPGDGMVPIRDVQSGDELAKVTGRSFYDAQPRSRG